MKEENNKDKVFTGEHDIKKQILGNKSSFNVSSTAITNADLSFLKDGESVIDSVNKKLYVRIGDELFFTILTKLT